MRRRGYSMVEMLVVIGLIMLLLTIAVPRYVKAIWLAKQVAMDEGKHQRHIGEWSKNVNSARSGSSTGRMTVERLRAIARARYRQTFDAGKFDYHLTEVGCGIRSDEEFRAYWHSLIGPDENAKVEISAGSVTVQDEAGNACTLERIGTYEYKRHTTYPIAWDFLSTNMQHMTTGNMGITAEYNDGTQAHLRYPGEFPATATVAELSQRFMDEVFPFL